MEAPPDVTVVGSPKRSRPDDGDDAENDTVSTIPTTVLPGQTIEPSDQSTAVEPNHDRATKRLKRDQHVGTKTNGDRADARRPLGRNEYFRLNVDKRERTQKTEQQQQQSGTDAVENGSAEQRRPKRKVAVLIGYSGTGYKGMQIMPDQPTIEGDIFRAFVAAGAISQANADDPKKSGLVRCARTDKGVHAAGNVISLKLIIEDADIVDRINKHLPSQIRVWGLHRTLGSFSCYKACDSRWYEYLLPSHTLIPPHPRSYLGRNIVALAEEADDMEGYCARQADSLSFWTDFDRDHVQPILDTLDEPVRVLVRAALKNDAEDANVESTDPTDESVSADVQRRADQAVRTIKKTIYSVKSAYRAPEWRKKQLADALAAYEGTHNFHNYTIQKRANDPSAKRHIKSFRLMDEPVIVNGTEWLSIKVHGQSFMMHQIRKMVSMAVLMTRCATPVSRIAESFGTTTISIPKAPGLGLLLERPVFESYNEKLDGRADLLPVDFDRHASEMAEFKQREIYDRIFREDGDENQFFRFFAHVDGYRDPYFLYLSSKGFDAITGRERVAPQDETIPKGRRGAKQKGPKLDVESDDEGVAVQADDR